MQAAGRGKLSVWAALLVAAGCAGRPVAPPPEPAGGAGELRRWLTVLAADSLTGRATGTEGATRAARFLATTMATIGLEPAGDSGFFQQTQLAASAAPAMAVGANVIGMLRGSDPARRDDAVVVGAHYDHLGVGPAVAGDSIYNGADDDGSGVVAVLGIARRLMEERPPARTVIFLLTTGEEMGLLGTRWYLAHPVMPLERTVADLQIEMVGRPDPLVGGAGISWLTGYERSTMGDLIRGEGLPIAPDPRPLQRFFERSDNIAFARAGIPAHTLSSYGMHADYHTPADEVERIDFAHLAGVVEAGARLVRLLADGEAPAWHPGGRP
ncbi:MAG TPA: M20/M25/M40 family metallo-hydrolase [Gemmatimonadales bacterium]|nr:M20/M25/M40 family metallo-hydrolase [Gemmatimonadales bacterium]